VSFQITATSTSINAILGGIYYLSRVKILPKRALLTQMSGIALATIIQSSRPYTEKHLKEWFDSHHLDYVYLSSSLLVMGLFGRYAKLPTKVILISTLVFSTTQFLGYKLATTYFKQDIKPESEIDKTRRETFQFIKALCDAGFGERNISQDEIDHFLLMMAGDVPPSKNYTRALTLVESIDQLRTSDPHNTRREANHIFTIICYVVPLYFPEQTSRLDCQELSPLEYINEVGTICMQTFLSGLSHQFRQRQQENPFFAQYANFFNALILFSQNPSIQAFEALAEQYLPALSPLQNAKLQKLETQYHRSFSSLEEAIHYDQKQEFIRFVQDRLPSKGTASFLPQCVFDMCRHSQFGLFHECIVDDILSDKEESPILELLDLFVADYISNYRDREGIWFHSGESNFGYARKEQDWKRLLVNNPRESSIETLKVGSTFLREVTTVYLDNFEECLDLFHTHSELSTSIEAMIPLLPIALTLPLDIHKTWEPILKETSKPTTQSRVDVRIFQRAFLKWALCELEKDHPALIKCLGQELELRVCQLDFLLHYQNLPITEAAQNKAERQQIAEKLQELLSKGVQAARMGCKNLVESRSPGKNVNLVLGIGFRGPLFNSNISSSHPNIVFLNLSEMGRRLPKKDKDLPNSLFSLPFLHATRYLMQAKDRNRGSDLFKIYILQHPSQADIIIHRYIFDKILACIIKQCWRGIHPELAPTLKREIGTKVEEHVTGCVNNRTKKIRHLEQQRGSKKTKPKEKESLSQQITQFQTEQERQTALKESILKKLHIEHPHFDQEEFTLIQQALDNKQSICVEAVITRHSRNNLIIPICFNGNREDIIHVDEIPILLGSYNRPVIPPCEHYCQLFSGSHLMWAELTRDTTLDEFDALDQSRGGRGVQDFI
jgi:hypothetical protein